MLTYKGVVMTWECDSNRHMNVMHYINKFENAGHNLHHELGLNQFIDLKKEGSVVLEQNIRYLKEVFEDDILYIESQLLEIGNKTMIMYHEMFHGVSKEMVCTMKLVVVLFDRINRRAIPLSPELKKHLTDLINN